MWGRASSAARGNDRFTARRRLRRRRVFIALIFLSLLIIGGVLYVLQQNELRITRVQIFGADQSLSDIALAAMQGTYLGVIPRDSTFFFPASRIRTDIIALHPDIAAVSIFRSGLTGLSIRINDRAPIALWCGLTPTFIASTTEAHGSSEYCYVFDASGFIFAAQATSTDTINNFKLYAPLAPLETPAQARTGVSDTLSLTGRVGDIQEPLRATIAHADQLPATFDLARQLATFGSPVVSIIVRGDEVDDMLGSGTRVTYVLGNEKNAFTALMSARQNMNLADGSIEYVDLRFDGKVYLKKNGEAPK